LEGRTPFGCIEIEDVGAGVRGIARKAVAEFFCSRPLAWARPGEGLRFWLAAGGGGFVPPGYKPFRRLLIGEFGPRLKSEAVNTFGSARKQPGAEVKARPVGAGLLRRTNVHE
jgi:hypothetical protein